MTTDRIGLEVGVYVTSTGQEKLTDLEKLLARIKAAQDKYSSSLGRGSNQQAKAARDALDIDRDRYRVLRMQMGYQARERRDQDREEQRGIREAGRLRAQEHRRALSEARELESAKDKARTSVGRGLSQAGGGARRLATTGAVAAAAATAVTQRTVDTLTRSAVTIDDAITQAQIHVFGDQDTATSRKSAEDLRKRLMPVASRLGTRTADLMKATVEAAQAGVADDLLDITVEQGTKYAKLNKLEVPDVLEQSGYALNGLKAFGKVTADTVKSYFDETSYLIATTSANRKELLSFTKTGLSSGASVGMNMEQTLAFGGAVTAAGGEGQQASRMLSTQGTRVADWRIKGRNIVGKHHRSAEDRQFLDAVQILGYRDSDSMADAFSKDFFGSLVNAQDKLKSISDPLKRKSITGQLFGKEFGALIDSMIMGGNMRDFHDKLGSAGGYLNKSWAKFTGNLGFILDKIGVVLGNLTETMGLALKPLWSEVSDFVDRFKGFDRAGDAVRSFTDGMLRGFGADSVTTLLTRIVGDPAKFQLDLRTVFSAGKGFAEGVSAVASGVKALFSAFAGPGADAQAMGKLAGEVIALSAALTVMAPALVTLASLTAIIGGLGRAAVGVAGLVGGGAAAGTAAGGLAAGAGAGAAGAAAGAAGGVAGAAGIAALALAVRAATSYGADKLDGVLGTNKDSALSASGVQRFAFKPGGALGYVYDWLTSEKKPDQGQDGHWADVGESKRLADMRRSLDKNTAAVTKNTEATKDEARKASESNARELQAAETKRLNELTAIRNPAMSGTVGGGGSSADALRARGFNVIGPGGGGGGGPPQAQGGSGGSDTASPDQKSGGSRSWRNNNPGNLEYGPFAKSMGAIGSDGRFAKFPTYEAGRKAQEKLLFDSKGYKDLTLSQAIRRWAPASENNVPAYIKAMGGDPGKRMSEYSPEQRGKLLDAMQRHEGWRPGTVAGGGGGGSPAGSGPLAGLGGTSKAVENARALLGAGSSQAAAALGSKMTPGQWCADFVNGALKSANIKGIQGSIATSFREWGAPVTDGIKAGDVVVTHRGRKAGETGGHVGLATGETRMKNGRLQYKTVSGNHGNKVGEGWEYGDQVEVRRAIEEAQKTRDLASGINRPSTAGKGAGPDPASPAPSQPQGGVLQMPVAPPRARDITSGVPQGGGRGRNGSAGGPVNVQIGAVHGGSPEKNGEEVGRKVREALNTHYGDVTPWGLG
ncbi:phage tail tape measure protein [Methylobacterium brachiatum]|uniref:phage tail tape measure protein n=1 Tax=Methylobacterium brachiatum TaxID=269660 RepID=UPI000EFB4D4B|nr:phage tail tape measure protein [Methylobacterium brachiatum]AYO84055.1 hypothetical protein EBB05_18480 [Methylobacterium brachiatum]